MKNFHLCTFRNRITYSSADLTGTLRKLNACGLEMLGIKKVDDFTICFETKDSIDENIVAILNHNTGSYQITRSATLWSNMKSLINRPVLLIGLIILLFLSVILPHRVLFVQIKGNLDVPDSLIASVADVCGIRFGASRKDVRSENVKNSMISKLPDLEWVGVNTYGCVAEISVRERAVEETTEHNFAVGNIVAARDGIILDCTTLQGTQICRPGQAVTKGQLLVSGYTDCGIYIQGTLPQADILASTSRELTILAPNAMTKRQAICHTDRRFRLIIGNILINFYKDSGISPTTCVKIYREYPLTLPGGFTLPVCIVKEELTYYDTAAEDADTQWANECGQEYLKTQMIAGKIISKQMQVIPANGVTRFEETYFCTEMIGQIKLEEKILAHGYDGKNSKCRTGRGPDRRFWFF